MYSRNEKHRIIDVKLINQIIYLQNKQKCTGFFFFIFYLRKND